MRLKLMLLVAMTVGLCVAENQTRQITVERPNVIVIMADDLGYNDLGFQGSPHIKTPHLDALAASGVIFTDAHAAAAVCSPSRAGFVTGRYQQRFGHEANIPPLGKGIDTSERTIGQAFQSLHYKTAIFGKWHLGNDESRYPTELGFDEFWGLREGSRSYWYEPDKSDKPGNFHAIEHNGKQVPFEGYLSDCLADRAIEFVKLSGKNPFFIFLSFTAPHTPLHAKPEDLKAADNNPYVALIQNMDMNIGRLLNTLQAQDLRENTMVWFLSDNGGIADQASNLPLNGKKGLKFEGGQRVPFILSWPARLHAGQRYDALTSSMDIYATSYAAAGGQPFTDKPLDGVDLIPFVTGARSGAPHAQLYWRRLGCAAMRDGRWKLIRIPGSLAALYDVEKDLGEKNNLAQSMPERAGKMLAALKNWETQMVDPLWSEGKYWTDWTAKTHAAMFESKTGTSEKTEK
ncbi:MAG: sulfatase-like hydrolase/transferase [Kiritimatiellae bacterium]|nr:sulfatase-like hydrolase/transferase [Kiritimatiellia bacterium]